jgi:hypothetical protein
LKLGKCLCPDKYYVSLQNTCVQCLNNQCKCPIGKVFKASLMGCGCPVDNSIYVRQVCISCNSANMTGAISASQTSCVCQPTFVWKNNMCQCSDRNSIVLNGSCYSCSGTNFNYSGKGVVSGNKCSCKSQFTWLPDQAICVCGVNSMYLSGKCYLCNQFANTVVSTGS